MNADAPQGRCSNLPQYCELAEAGTPQDMSAPNAGCRNCGMALMPLSRRSGEQDAAVWMTLAKRAALMVAVLAAIFGGFELSKQLPSPAAPMAKEARRDALDQYLVRLSGSSTLAQKLVPDLAAAWLASKGATHIEAVERRDDQGASLPGKVVSGEIDGKLVGLEIKGRGTATGLEALRAGDADIWLASAPATAEEAGALEDTGGLSEHVLGLDGVAVVVSPSNPLRSLTRAQLKDIFSGAIRDWKELRLPPGAIDLYARSEGSGTRASFEAVVLGPDAKMAPLVESKPEGYGDNEELAHDVAHDPRGIGFVSMDQVGPAKALEIKDGSAAALAPTVFTVRTESYPLSRRLYLYAAAQPSEDASAFIDFALGEAGQAIVEKSLVGLLPTRQTAREADTRPCALSKKYPGDKRAFCDLRARAFVIDSSFRFKNGSFDLDALAAKNLERVLETLKQGPEGRRVVLAGFADGRGDYAADCKLALKGAETVKEALVSRGLANVEARGFCSEAPVRDNAGADHEQNRRVEVYELDAGSAQVR